MDQMIESQGLSYSKRRDYSNCFTKVYLLLMKGLAYEHATDHSDGLRIHSTRETGVTA